MIRVSWKQHRAVGANHISQERQDAVERKVQVELIERAMHENQIAFSQTKIADKYLSEVAFGKFGQTREPGTLALFLFANYRLVGSGRKNFLS